MFVWQQQCNRSSESSGTERVPVHIGEAPLDDNAEQARDSGSEF